MWERLKQRPRGRVSQRHLPLLVTGFLVAVLLCVGLGHTAYAEDATRTADGFTYQGDPYTVVVTMKPGDSRKLASTATGDITAYENINPQQTKAKYLLFASGVDPKTATTALYTSFDYTPPSTYSNQSPSPPQVVTISAITATTTAQNSSGCHVPWGVGWILCPVGGAVGAMVDGFYGIIMSLMDVKPLLSGGPIYDIWNAVRSIANVVFIIVFLVIIFSQITSLGLSTYGIRKALPRLVVVAIIVNLSYIICALGIDLSNYLGHSVYALFSSFTQSLGTSTVDITWSALVAAAFAGGTAGGIVIGHLWFSVAFAGSIPALLFTVLGMLITVAVAALTGLIILAARQALLVLFVIISPLAFVAAVLPSTEKWYKKWHETAMAMLIMYPIFAAVFGGAMLAGAAIIIGAGGNIFLVILGKAVQVIPLAITPVIIKFSTGLLGTIARITNDKNKGLIDRARKWTAGQTEHHRKKSLGPSRPLLPGRFGKMGWRGTAQMFDSIDRRQKKEQEGFEAASQARAQRTVKYRRADNFTRKMTQGKQLSDAQLDRSWYRHLGSTAGKDTLREYLDLRNTTDEASGGKANVENIYNDLRKGKATKATKSLYGKPAAKDMARRAYIAAEELNVTAIRKAQADQEVLKQLNKQLLSDGKYTDPSGAVMYRQVFGEGLQEYAAGIGNAKRMLAIETEKARKIEGQEANAAAELMKHFNIVDANDFVNLATKKDGKVTRIDSSGNKMTFRFSDEDVRAAAIAWVAKNGAYSQRKDLALSAADPDTNAKLAAYIQSELIANGFGAMAPWANDKTISIMGAGGIASMDDIMFHNFREIQEGRVKGEGLLSANNTALAEFFGTFKDREAGNNNWDDYLDQQEAMMRREMDGKPAATINTAVADFRASINDRYIAKYYDIMEQTKKTLDDPQLSARLNPQSKAEMEKAVTEFYGSALGQQQVSYRNDVKAAQDAAKNGTATPAQRMLLDSFYKIYN